MSGRLLTARQVAETIGVSAETVLRWTRRGKLPGFRLPSGAIRYRETDFDEWLEAHATAAPGRESASNPGRRRQDNGILPVPAIPLPSAARDEED